MLDQEGHQMTGQLQDRNIGVEIHAVDTLTLEGHMLIEYSIDVRHRYLLRARLPQGRYHAEHLSGRLSQNQRGVTEVNLKGLG